MDWMPISRQVQMSFSKETKQGREEQLQAMQAKSSLMDLRLFETSKFQSFFDFPL